MESELFDKDEIIPNGYNSYEAYIDDINNFLYKYQTLFISNIYNSSNELIYTEKSVHGLINKDYEKLPKEFLSYFNSIKAYLSEHKAESKIIFEYLMDLSSDELFLYLIFLLHL